MIGAKQQSQVSNRAVGVRVQSSVYGSAIPYLAGRYRCTPLLIWSGDFQSHQASSGKKAGGKKGGGGTYTYSAAADWLLGHYPMHFALAGWNNKDYYPVGIWQMTGTVPSTDWLMVTPPSGYGGVLGILGVYLVESYSVSFDDYGGDGPVTLSGTWKRPLSNENFTRPDGQSGLVSRPYTYYWNPPQGQTVWFYDPYLQGKTVEIWFATGYPGPNGAGDVLSALNLEFENYLASGSEYVTAPGQQVPYNWVSGLGSVKFDLGSSDMFPQFSVEVQSGLNLWPEGGCDPADIITDLFHSGSFAAGDAPHTGETIVIGHGLNMNAYSASGIPLPVGDFLGDLTAMRNYCRANGISCSVYLDSQAAARDTIGDLFDLANCAPVWSGSKLKAVPYSEVSTAGNGAIFTAPTASGPVCAVIDDRAFYLKDKGSLPVTVERNKAADAKNVVVLSHVADDSEGQSGHYNDMVTTEVEQGSVHQFGPVPDTSRQLRMITKKSVGQKVASVLVKRLAFDRLTHKFTLPAGYCFLEAMDLVPISDPSLGPVSVAVRLKSVKETFSDKDGWLYECEAWPFVYGVNAPTPTDYTQTNPYDLSSNANPGDVSAPTFFEPPDALEEGGYWLWIAVCGADLNWGGCSVWLSSDGVDYGAAPVGSVLTKPRMGVLTATLPSASDPDNTNTLAVDLTESFGELATVSAGDKDAFRSLCLVNGELVSYETATLTGAYCYDLTALRRGAYSTPIASHSSGAPFVRLDDSIFRLKLDASWVGKTVHLKFTSFNTRGGGVQDLGSATAYTYVFQGTYNNFLQVVANDAQIIPGLDGTGGAKIELGGPGGAYTSIILYKSDGTTTTIGPFSAFTGLPFTTGYYVMYNPITGQCDLVTNYSDSAVAIFHGHILLGSCVTPNSGGSGGSNGGGGGGFGGGGNGFKGY